MIPGQKRRGNIEVGASKAAKVLLGGLDRRLTIPATVIVRYSGWILITLIVYLTYFGNITPKEHRFLIFWIIAYVAYMLLLEVARKYASETYEAYWFRAIRLMIMLMLVSVLVSILPEERHILIFAYMFSLLAAVVYFGENIWVVIGVFLLAVCGIYVGETIFIDNIALKPEHFLLYSLVLAVLTLFFEVVRNRIIRAIPGGLITDLAKDLHKTLDLQQLMTKTLQNAMSLTVAQRGLIIVINPRTKKYVGHALHNFKFRSGMTVESLARNCFVLIHGQPFDNPDIFSTFNDQSIYYKYFLSQPRSVLAEPLYNREHEVIGVINVAHNNTHGFDKFSKLLLKEFAFLVGTAIENCFEHRQIKLREARGREAGGKFISAGSEDEAINILIEEVRRQIPNVEKLTIHQLLPETGDLLPIHSYSIEETPNTYLWSGPKPSKLKPDLRIGYGIAGHALELRDTILVPDVEIHPWFVKLEHAQYIKSLLVAPIFGVYWKEPYGTVSLESSKPFAFNLEDESTLTYLATQTSRSITKVKEFQAWREQGSILRQILEQIQSFDLSATEDEILQRISDTAIRLLGFKIARIRILNEQRNLVTKAVSGVPEETRRKLMEIDLPYEELKPFLNDSYKAESSYLVKHGDPAWELLVNKYFHVSKQKLHNQQGWHKYDALITPLLGSSSNTLGVLTLDIPNNGLEPNQQLLESIGVFASSAGWMIDLGRYQKRFADQRQRAQSFINTISHELAKCKDLPTICEVVVQVGAKLLSAEGCSLYLVLENENEIELTHSNYLANTDYITRRKPISDQPKSGLTAWVAATGQVLCFNHEQHTSHEAWAEETEQLQLLPSKKCSSVLLAPVKDSEGKIIGVISLENKKTLTGLKDFDEQDIERLKGLADEFARALQVIGIYDDVREWERAGLADDIHDLINWHHSGIVSWIEALDEWLRRSNYEKAKELSTQLKQHALTFVQELKIVHTNFLDKSLEAPTFRQALKETLLAWTKHVASKYDKRQMRIIFECPVDLHIPIKIRNTIIRFASLAFSNAILHSGIIDNSEIEVRVRVEHKDEMITLAVIDNGRGIDYKMNPPGFGMDRMKQLVKKINHWGGMEANFQIQTGVNMGTKVRLDLQKKVTNTALPKT